MTGDELNEYLAALERVSMHYPAESPESKAIAMGAEALIFAFGEKTRSAFAAFFKNRDRPLTEAQRLHLRSLGIDPDLDD